MSKYTDYLNLFKWEPEIDGDEEFDIEKALNENWDKLDAKIKQHILNTAQTILDFETETNQNFQTEMEKIESNLEAYKETVDAEIEDFKKNSFATVEMVNGYVSDTYDPSKTYNVDDYCIYDNILYKCKTAITTGEAFNSTKWEQTSISKELSSRPEFEVIETW